MSTLAFTPDRMERFKKTVAKYETKRSALLPTLYLAQEQFGFLSPEAIKYVAGLLEIPEVHVFEAVSFYLLFKKKDMGKYCLQVCNNITCTLMGSEDIMTAIREETGLAANQVSEDRTFSLVPVQCLGSCDTAPVVQVNEDYFENMTPESTKELLRKLKKGEKVAPPSEVSAL